MVQTNPKCVNSDSRCCEALAEIHPKCFEGECPFFKTDSDFKVTEAKARRRCETLGIDFKSRNKVIDEMFRQTTKTRKCRNKKLQPRKVVHYNLVEHSFTEYESLEQVSDSLNIPIIKLEYLIKKNESYNGNKFIYV